MKDVEPIQACLIGRLTGNCWMGTSLSSSASGKNPLMLNQTSYRLGERSLRWNMPTHNPDFHLDLTVLLINEQTSIFLYNMIYACSPGDTRRTPSATSLSSTSRNSECGISTELCLCMLSTIFARVYFFFPCAWSMLYTSLRRSSSRSREAALRPGYTKR